MDDFGHFLWRVVAALTALLAVPVGATAAPARVVSLAPNATQMVRHLGAGNRLVAVTPFCEAPDNIARLPGGMFTDPETVLSFEPDLVLCSPMTPADTRRQMSDLGLHVEVVETPSLEGIRAATRRVAALLEIPAPAEFPPAPAATGAPTTLLLFGADTGFSAGRGTYVHEILEAAGLRNVAAEAASPWPDLNEEFLLEKDPEILVIAGDPATRDEVLARLRAHPVRRHLRAVRDGKVVIFPAGAFIVPGPRALDAAAKLRAALPSP